MSSLRVPEKLDERRAVEAFPRIQLNTAEETGKAKVEASRQLALAMHDYSLKFQRIEAGLDSKLKEDEIKKMESEIDSYSRRIGDSKLEQYARVFKNDVRRGVNPFRGGYLPDMEFLMRNEYGHSTLTTPDGRSGIAEVTERRSAERSGHEFTILNTEVIGIPRPNSRFFTLRQGTKERDFVEIMSDPAEDKHTKELLFHLQNVAEGKEEPRVGMLFGHNRFLGGDSRIIGEEDYKKLDNPEYIGFVKKWVEALFKDNDHYKIDEALMLSNDAEGIFGIKDPQMWIRVQMLRHMKAGIDELSFAGPGERIPHEKLMDKIQVAFNEVSENHEIQHAINKIERPNMPDWLDELTTMLSSIHGHSKDYRGSPQFSMSIIVPLFSLAVEKLEKVSDLGQLDYGERAAFTLVYGIAKLDKDENPGLGELDKNFLMSQLNPTDALERIAKMDSFILRQRAIELEKLAYE